MLIFEDIMVTYFLPRQNGYIREINLKNLHAVFYSTALKVTGFMVFNSILMLVNYVIKIFLNINILSFWFI